jgi:hypothetical protein
VVVELITLPGAAQSSQTIAEWPERLRATQLYPCQESPGRAKKSEGNVILANLNLVLMEQIRV